MVQHTRQDFLSKLEAIEPKLRKAFEAAVQDLQTGAQLRALREAIADGDVEGAFRALRIDEAIFSPYLDEIRAAFNEGGLYEATAVPKAALAMGALARFDGNHPRAVAFAREHAADRVTGPRGFIEEARRLVRQVIVASAEANRPPQETALAIIGRRSPGGQRVGGLLGLSEPQGAYVMGMRAALLTPEGQREYLETDRWRRRDRSPAIMAIVRRAYLEGRPLRPAELARVTERYTQRLLKLRGETIARTESLHALNAGRYEGLQQLMEKNGLPQDAVTLIWQATPSKRTRDTHMAMHNQAIKFGEAFVSFERHRMRFPGDPELGAPPEELINCRCTARSKIDFTRLRRG